MVHLVCCMPCEAAWGLRACAPSRACLPRAGPAPGSFYRVQHSWGAGRSSAAAGSALGGCRNQPGSAAAAAPGMLVSATSSLTPPTPPFPPRLPVTRSSAPMARCALRGRSRNGAHSVALAVWWGERLRLRSTSAPPLARSITALQLQHSRLPRHATNPCRPPLQSTQLRYANNSNYKNDTMIRKECFVGQAVLDELRRIIEDSEVRWCWRLGAAARKGRGGRRPAARRCGGPHREPVPLPPAAWPSHTTDACMYHSLMTPQVMKEDDSNWPAPDRVGRQELEIVLGSEHISFATTKLGSLLQVRGPSQGGQAGRAVTAPAAWRRTAAKQARKQVGRGAEGGPSAGPPTAGRPSRRARAPHAPPCCRCRAARTQRGCACFTTWCRWEVGWCGEGRLMG